MMTDAVSRRSWGLGQELSGGSPPISGSLELSGWWQASPENGNV